MHLLHPSEKFNTKRYLLLPLVIAVTFFLWLVPTDFFGIDGLTVVEQRTIARRSHRGGAEDHSHLRLHRPDVDV